MFAHLPLLLAFWSIFASAQLPVLPIVTDLLPIELLTNLTNNGECALSSECAGGCANASTIRPPLILVHGFFGNKMYLDGKNTPFPANFPLLCTQVFAARYSIKGWINPLLAVGTLNMTNIQECLFYLMSLSYDQTTDTYRNQTGVDVTFLARKEFGCTCPSTCWVSDSFPGGCALSSSSPAPEDETYFAPLINKCLVNFGYTKGCNLFAAPYDWRLTPGMDYTEAYFVNLTTLIEKSVNATGKKAVLLCHSLGNLVVNYYLNQRMSQEWQNWYLSRTINTSGPYGGTTFIIEQILSGNVDRLFPGLSLIVPNLVVRKFIRTLAAVAFLLPNSLAFQSDTKLASISGINYTFADLAQLLSVANIAQMQSLYQSLSTQIDANKYTPMFCVHSISDKGTPAEFDYPNGIDKKADTKMGPGDGLINAESMRVCQKWKEQGKLVDSVTEIVGPTHVGILHSDQFCQLIKTIAV
ncbi:hypothetical protein niasHT_026056 [Heterodera trifolii]|uniref:Uncharacterized protein n=1 Tax=Heterodera trifolii TaxID=157864 RepID=A0ABD2KR50_9BILA